VSRERALRRAERERHAAEQEASRAAEAERQARRDARRSRLTRWFPSPGPAADGVLAARRRQQTGLVVALVVTVNVLTLLGTGSWAPRVLVLLLSVLLTPIVLSLMSRR
jgi:Flp pilus assembly protein TadB